MNIILIYELKSWTDGLELSSGIHVQLLEQELKDDDDDDGRGN